MFKIQHIFYMVSIMLVMMGCANTSTEKDASNEQSVQPIHYEENRNQQSLENSNDAEIQPPAPSFETFDREESAAFQERVRENVEVEDAQVVTAADRVVVAVQMKKGTDNRDFEEISKDIEQILDTDKQLFIYNNTAKWERVKDFNAREEANQMGEDMERLFQELFE
ncbi:YhcN/YlaJ family sporulation lipoprotein [Oceanobacillus jeddahense]|uniref:YhcN/YlaJ family sporulation lipoprotein n=1 Tax=Oceanobacillus jeddahense TaxID=1462527 RepID=A0ABY5K2G9_9BACI|nr:YhcN/YlaJ family sporulation lipoprotein [Oceanobacillus jeddahense]UUI05347.1 YhcN/YlaJ family sporulation lipoprotein [Oceanobacillus jeddahense]